MKQRDRTFLDLSLPYTDPDNAAVHILPLPYDGAVSYGSGAALAPNEVIEASGQVELYDEILCSEPYKAGIATLAAPDLPQAPHEMVNALYGAFKGLLLSSSAALVGIGGDHSVTVPHVQALCDSRQPLSVIQLDAHADLRDTYQDTPYSHACVMRRVRECTPHTLQLGIRSLCVEEAGYIESQQIPVRFMHGLRTDGLNIKRDLATLPDPVFITLDVDVLDWSVVSATGTPEPGGFTWNEIIHVLTLIFRQKQVIGFDVVELSAGGPVNSAFAVARLIYKMIGLMLPSAES